MLVGVFPWDCTVSSRAGSTRGESSSNWTILAVSCSVASQQASAACSPMTPQTLPMMWTVNNETVKLKVYKNSFLSTHTEGSRYKPLQESVNHIHINQIKEQPESRLVQSNKGPDIGDWYMDNMIDDNVVYNQRSQCWLNCLCRIQYTLHCIHIHSGPSSTTYPFLPYSFAIIPVSTSLQGYHHDWSWLFMTITNQRCSALFPLITKMRMAKLDAWLDVEYHCCILLISISDSLLIDSHFQDRFLRFWATKKEEARRNSGARRIVRTVGDHRCCTRRDISSFRMYHGLYFLIDGRCSLGNLSDFWTDSK